MYHSIQFCFPTCKCLCVILFHFCFLIIRMYMILFLSYFQMTVSYSNPFYVLPLNERMFLFLFSCLLSNVSLRLSLILLSFLQLFLYDSLLFPTLLIKRLCLNVFPFCTFKWVSDFLSFFFPNFCRCCWVNLEPHGSVSCNEE